MEIDVRNLADLVLSLRFCAFLLYYLLFFQFLLSLEISEQRVAFFNSPNARNKRKMTDG